MPKVTFDIPADVKGIISKHKEIDWNRVISDTLWGYARKIKLLDSITSKSKLSNKDISALDHEIKSGLIKKYQN